MKIQVFSQYYNLAPAGKLDFLACPMHKEDPEVIFPLIHKDENEKIVLHCLACGYKNLAGLQLYENMIEKIKKVENEISTT
jgi:hypothetical protein